MSQRSNVEVVCGALMHHACFGQDTLNEKLKHRGAERLRHVQKPDEVMSGGSVE